MPELLAYHAYPNPAVAETLLALLDEQGIVYQVHHAKARYNPMLGTSSTEQFVVSLRPEDFTRVRALEEAQADASAPEFPADYYLFGFSNAELWELLAQPDAWSSHDVALAARLLRERGETVTDDALANLRTQRTAALATPDPHPTNWIVAGYVLVLLGGALGIAIGWHLWKYHKTLPTGQQVPAFAEPVRREGRRMALMGAIVLAGWLGWRLWQVLPA